MASLVDQSGNIAYFGRLSWGNFLDWLVTLCLGTLLVVVTASLGGVRADAQVVILPLFFLLLVLHGLWLAAENESPKRLSHVPVAFLPFFVWAIVNVYWLSPAAWLGRYELIYGLEAFIFFWVAVNNVRTRMHLWALLVIGLSPLAYALVIGFYQFFQNPLFLASALADHGIVLSPEFLGQATGSFADPHSYGVFLLLALSVFLVVGGVPRLPGVLRVFSLYLVLMCALSLVFTQIFWPLLVLVPIIFIVPGLCYEGLAKRLFLPFGCVVLLLLALGGLAWLHPPMKESLELAVSKEGEGVRVDLWEAAGRIFLDQPITGVGGGSFSLAFEQSPSVSLGGLPETPHNDYLLLLSEYGLVGALLLGLPIGYVIVTAVRRWKGEPLRVNVQGVNGLIMPQHKFFLALGLAGFSTYALCSFVNFVFYVPALALYGVLFFSILIKSSLKRSWVIPRASLARWGYVCVGFALGAVLYFEATPLLRAQAIELEARQRLDQLIAHGVHVSGNAVLFDAVVEKYETAAELDPTNADVWIGLSAAHCQRFFSDPSRFHEFGSLASSQAQRAAELSEGYWRAWAQLGVAKSLVGDSVAAESALRRALDLAPNSSQAHYFLAEFLSNFPDKGDEAMRLIERSLEINPDNSAARRRQQKLLIL